jgi:hypothetical protein
VDKVEPDDSTSKWQVATANGHTCDAGCGGGDRDREHAPKRARTSAVDSTRRQLATGPLGREHHGIDSVIDGAVNAVLWRGLMRVVPTRLMLAVSGYLVEG